MLREQIWGWGENWGYWWTEGHTKEWWNWCRNIESLKQLYYDQLYESCCYSFKKKTLPRSDGRF